MRDLPVAGRVFDDIIDGYFPLAESLRQMLKRNGFGAALVAITHAPILHLAGDDGGPVPMRLDTAKAGVLRWLWGLAVLKDGSLHLTGLADWRWPDADQPVSSNTRLAEPAFLRGIGLRAGTIDGGAFGLVATERTSGLCIAGPDQPGWGFKRTLDGIEREPGVLPHSGKAGAGSGPRLRIALPNADNADALRALERDLGACSPTTSVAR